MKHHKMYFNLIILFFKKNYFFEILKKTIFIKKNKKIFQYINKKKLNN